MEFLGKAPEQYSIGLKPNVTYFAHLSAAVLDILPENPETPRDDQRRSFLIPVKHFVSVLPVELLESLPMEPDNISALTSFVFNSRQPGRSS